MYVQITKNIVQTLDYITENFDCEVSTGKNDKILLRVYFPKEDTNPAIITNTITSLQERFGTEQEMLHHKPVIWDRDGYYIHFFKLQSERIGK